MQSLKKQIQICEINLQMHKSLLRMHKQQFLGQTRNLLASPITWVGAFLAGFFIMKPAKTVCRPAGKKGLVSWLPTLLTVKKLLTHYNFSSFKTQ